jgi:hypothetical protein
MMVVSISEVVSGSVLNASTSLVDAITLQAQGAVTQVELVSWLCSFQFDLAQCGLLIGILDGATFGQVMNAQKGLIAAAASKQSGGVISCKVSKKGAVSLYGLGQMPITLYAAQWERFLASQGATDVAKSSILTLCKDESAKSDYCFADYVFAKSKDSYGAPLKGEDLKYAQKLALGQMSESHSFLIDGKPASTSSTAIDMVNLLQSGDQSESTLTEVRRKCAGIKIVVRPSRK